MQKDTKHVFLVTCDVILEYRLYTGTTIKYPPGQTLTGKHFYRCR